MADEPPRVRRHVFGRTQINIAALDVARLARVRLGGEAQLGNRCHPLDGLEHRRGTDTAVDADERGAAALQLRDETLGRGAVERVAAFLRGHLGDDRRGRDAANRLDRRTDFVQIAERLEDEEIHAAGGQRLRLLAEVRLRLVDASFAPGLDADPKRAD